MYRLGSLVSKVCSLSSSPFSFRSRLLVTTLPPPAFFVHKKVFQATVVGLEKSTCVGKGRDPFNGKLLATPQSEGSNQFKPIFLGTGVLNKTLITQECIHAGGKHNDLDDAGKDTNHRTVFEMLGHWSFGDYFKTQAISWAWEHLMQVYKLSADRMYAMYFGGDEKLSLEDIEARDTGLELLPPARLFSFGCKEGGIKKPLASFTVGLATTVGRVMGNIRAIRKSSPFNYQLVRLYGSTPKKYFRIWWIYPPEGFYKGNSDATYVEGTDLAWVGGIIRDDQAEHVRSYCKEVRAPTSPLSEAKGVSVLIRYAVKHNFLPLVVEIDCKAVADKAMSDIEEAHPIYREMQSLVKEHNVIVYGAYEDVNEIAHLLARLKCEGMHEFKDISEVPLSIQADVKKYLEHEKANKPYYRARGPKKPRNKK